MAIMFFGIMTHHSKQVVHSTILLSPCCRYGFEEWLIKSSGLTPAQSEAAEQMRSQMANSH